MNGNLSCDILCPVTELFKKRSEVLKNGVGVAKGKIMHLMFCSHICSVTPQVFFLHNTHVSWVAIITKSQRLQASGHRGV